LYYKVKFSESLLAEIIVKIPIYELIISLETHPNSIGQAAACKMLDNVKGYAGYS
jgi:hypothetical protein